MTSVWPALCPPWKRTTTSARSDSQSTILPLPSSPHWAPTTTTLVMPHARCSGCCRRIRRQHPEHRACGMTNVVVVGAQWGDEGKGKIVDWLSERADVVVRFQGGHNAGHTLVVGNVEYKLSLLPSGVVRPGKLSIIGNGVVVDPWALVAEIDVMRAKGLA